MSERNGDRARFQRNRQRKLRRRQRVQHVITARRARTEKSVEPVTAGIEPLVERLER